MRESLRQFAQLIKDVLQGPVPEGADSFDESVLESDRKTRLMGYWVVAIVFGGFGLWAAVAPLESAARGQGTVRLMVIANRYSTTRGYCLGHFCCQR